MKLLPSLAPPSQGPRLIPSTPSISTMCGSSPGADISFLALKLSIESAMTRALVLWEGEGRGERGKGSILFYQTWLPHQHMQFPFHSHIPYPPSHHTIHHPSHFTLYTLLHTTMVHSYALEPLPLLSCHFNITT